MPVRLRYLLNVADFEASVHFWTTAMGFPLSGGWDRGPDDRGALVDVAPGAVVEIVGHGPDAAPVEYRQQAVAVELVDRQEVDAFRERLAGFGIDASPPVEQHWGHYSTTTRDPSQLEVVLFCEITV